jgi:hypothetical protein
MVIWCLKSGEFDGHSVDMTNPTAVSSGPFTMQGENKRKNTYF